MSKFSATPSFSTISNNNLKHCKKSDTYSFCSLNTKSYKNSKLIFVLYSEIMLKSSRCNTFLIDEMISGMKNSWSNMAKSTMIFDAMESVYS